MCSLRTAALYVFMSAGLRVATAACPDPRASLARSYSDFGGSLVTAQVHMVTFSLICPDGDGYDHPVFFRVNDGPDFGAAAIVDVNNNFQISWTRDAYAPVTEFSIGFFDEQSYSLARKFPDAVVKPMTTLYLEHPGTMYKPWFPSEVVAIGIAFLLICHAISSRARIA